MFGWMGKILFIDLKNLKYEIKTPEVDIFHKFIGGRGLGGYFLTEYIEKNWNDPQMPFLMLSGPLVGTASPTSGRSTFMSKSPLTGTIGDSSVGGKFGTFLKRSGFDAVIIQGKSDKFIGIEISENRVEFIDASYLKGADTGKVFEKLKDKGSVATIGAGGENGVLFSSIVVDKHHFAGRNGLGAIWGDKKIKYISCKGSLKVDVYDEKGLKKAKEDIFRLIAASPVLKGEFGISNFGTGALFDLIHSRRMMPTNNFRETFFEKAPQLNAYAYKHKYSSKKGGCRGCHILCKRLRENGDSLPEFETMSHFSALLGNSNMDTVVKANDLCTFYGIDTISCGATISCYSEIIDKQLKSEEILNLIKLIGETTGVGKELAQGSYRFAKKHGKPEVSISVKKQELAAYDPRGAYGMALAYAVSTRGGDHLRAYTISHEILRKPVFTDRFSFNGKARIIKITEDLNAVVDSLTACKFVFFAASLEEYAKAYSSVTGIKTTADDLYKIGERICYNEKILNFRNGFSSSDDDLPPRFFNEPGSYGNSIKIPPLNREEFIETKRKYYKIRGLCENGKPLKEKAGEFGLKWKN
jgi:aldehyde:ferredoxin oxidoreductase